MTRTANGSLSNDDLAVGALAAFGALTLIPAIVVLTTFLRGYAVMLYWRWFIVPTFAAAPHLSLSASIGVGMMGSLLAGARLNSDGKSMKTLLGGLAFYYGAVYLVGYIIHVIIS